MSHTLLTNAVVVTIDDAMTVHRRGHVLVEDGAIAAVGDGPGPTIEGAEVIDLGGDLLIPGMVNTHCHMAMTLFRGLGDDEPDRLRRYIFPLEARFVSEPMVHTGSLLAAIELLEGGVTTVADMYYFETQAGRAVDEAGMRGVVGQSVVDFAAPDAATPEACFARFDELARAYGGHSRVTPSLAPHAPYTTGLEILAQVDEAARAAGAPVQIHLAEMDYEMPWVKERYGGTPVDLLEQAGLLRPGVIAAHCLRVDARDIAKLAEGGVGVAHNVGANIKGGRGIAPVVEMLRAGVTVGLGSDGPMSGNTIDLFAQLPQVAKMQKLRAQDRTVMPADEVARLATRGGAAVLGMADRIGSIEAGKRADLVRVRRDAARLQPVHDVYSALVYAATAADVRDVMVDGRFVVRDGRITTLDRTAVFGEADALVAAMRRALDLPPAV